MNWAGGHPQVTGARLEAVDGPRVCIAGRWLLDFTSSDYLGFARHPAIVAAIARATRDWGASLAAPRLLSEDPYVAPLERALVALTGQEDAVVFSSTTHAALDILPSLAGPRGAILADAWAYPTSLAGAAVAARRGAHLGRFPHDDAIEVERLLRRHAAATARVIVCDGVYSAAGPPASLAAFARLARGYRAALFVDDANGIGLLGARPTGEKSWGRGGGGTPRWSGIPPGRLVHVGTLAKAFGVPVAFAAGPGRFVARLRASAPSLIHSSPPAVPVAAAALAAMRLNASQGEALRTCLIARIEHFRAGLANLGLLADPGPPLPVQAVRFAAAHMATAVARHIGQFGVRLALQLGPPDAPGGGALRFIVTANHELSDLDFGLDALDHALRAARGYRAPASTDFQQVSKLVI